MLKLVEGVVELQNAHLGRPHIMMKMQLLLMTIIDLIREQDNDEGDLRHYIAP